MALNSLRPAAACTPSGWRTKLPHCHSWNVQRHHSGLANFMEPGGWWNKRASATRLGLENFHPMFEGRNNRQTRRRYSAEPQIFPQSSPGTIDWAKHSIFVSTSTDPYFNLTLEDMLFRRHDPRKPLLLIYRDDPCVVIGRNQNVWKEVNLQRLNSLGIPFVRRRSGGGTVYHDLGNTNYSIHLPRASFDRNATAQVVVRAIRRLGINGRVNERNDICVGTDKISSAYKIVNSRSYHHGTMLISTRLDTLGDLLRVSNNKEKMITKGVASVRSPVCNLQQHDAGITHEAFESAVIQEFRHEYAIASEVCNVADTKLVREDDHIRQGMEELKTWGWAYGSTPEFTYNLERTFPWGHLTVDFHSKHGVVLNCSMQLSGTKNATVDRFVGDLASSLMGQHYGFFKFGNDSNLSDLGTIPQDLKTWLIHETN